MSREQLLALLAERSESPSLEYIGDCDLAERRDIVELATEVGAMAARGGWIVIGVDGNGEPTGDLDARKLGLFDEAALSDKLARYLPSSVALQSAEHDIASASVVLLHVSAHPDSAVAFLNEGTFEQNGKPATAFRKGDIFVRHGTKSERPTQADIREIGERAIAGARLWVGELHGVEEAIGQVSLVVDEERLRAPGGRLGSYGMITRLPAARRRLAGRIAAFERAGGPPLPLCRELAEGNSFTSYIQLYPAIFSATDELARAIEQHSPT